MAGVTFVWSYLSTFSLCNSGQPALFSSLPKAGKITIHPAVTSNRQMASEFPAIVILFFWVVLQIVTGFFKALQELREAAVGVLAPEDISSLELLRLQDYVMF